MDLITHVKPKGEDGAAQIAELVAAVERSGDSPVLGLLLKVLQGASPQSSSLPLGHAMLVVGMTSQQHDWES